MVDIKIEKRKEIFSFRERGHGFVHVTSMEHVSSSDSTPAQSPISKSINLLYYLLVKIIIIIRLVAIESV